jgi:hypothetical protein
MTATDDFPVTRRAIDRLDEWLMALASPLLPLQQVPAGPPDAGGFRWAFRETTERALLVGKAVRLISALRAGLILADAGYVTGCGTILRTVQDFSNEIIAVCEGCKSGTPTTAQKQFVEQYFVPTATTPEEYDKQEQRRFVARDKLLAAHTRWATEVGVDPDRVRQVLRFLAQAYDKYVHGAYITAMELYSGATHRFMLRGHESERYQRVCKQAFASTLHEGLAALCCISEVAGMPALYQEIRQAAQELYRSGETSGALLG